MREIKFRAWDGRQMVHDGDYWNGENRQNDVPSFAYAVSVTNKGILWCEKLGPLKPGDIVRDEEGNEGYRTWEIDRMASDVKIMQYTGLKDKNGVEIYEGDILAFDNGFCDVVRFERSAWRWNRGHNILGISWHSERSLSVIGNIYENPELLEK